MDANEGAENPLVDHSSYVTYESTTASSSQLYDTASVLASEFSIPLSNAPTLDLRETTDLSNCKSIPTGLVLVRTERGLKKTDLIGRLYRLSQQTGKHYYVTVLKFSDFGLHVVNLSAEKASTLEIRSHYMSDTEELQSDRNTLETKTTLSTIFSCEP